MTDENNNKVEEGASPLQGPGRRLREARESRKFSQQQVASQLRMQVKIIEALEEDDYSALPGITFVQGYLRSYARLLGLPEQSILGLMPSDRTESTPELVSSISDGKIEVSSSDLPFRMISVLVILAALAGLGWWFSQQTPSPELFESVPMDNGAELGLALPDVVEVASEEPPSEEPQPEEAVGEEEISLEVEEAEPIVEEEQPVSTPQPEPVVQVSTPVAPDSPELLPTTPQSKLELEYQADSWSEIYDAAGRNLNYGLVPAGTNLKLYGEAPFRVFLGYASGVTVYYNGDLYDHSPYQRGDVARFRIGRAEHNRPLAGN